MQNSNLLVFGACKLKEILCTSELTVSGLRSDSHSESWHMRILYHSPWVFLNNMPPKYIFKFSLTLSHNFHLHIKTLYSRH